MDITSIYRSSLKATNLYSGRNNIGKAYRNGNLIYLRPKYKAGFNITYKVDSSTEYTELVNAGASVLSPTSFTPTKSGYTFVGWKEDTTANSSVLTSKNAGEETTLYAVFKKDVTLTYYDNSTTAATKTGAIYYNNGTVNNPSFTMTQAASTAGFTTRGWSTTNKGNATVNYSNGATITLTDNLTIYGLYQKTITVTYYNGSTTASSTTGTRYWAPAGYIDPSFKLAQASKSGWSARGWSTGTAGNSSITYNNNTAFTRDSNVTLYGMYQQTITVTYYNGSTTASSTTGTRYWNSGKNVYVDPSFKLAQASKSGWTARGWASGTAGDASISYNNNTSFTRSSNITLYGMYQQTITVTYYNNSTSASTTTGTRYWNSGKNVYVNPSFTLTQASKSGWTARGWSTTNAGNASASYSNGTAFSRSSNVTLYGMYYKTITVSYNANGGSGSTSSHTATVYWAPAGTVGASVTLAANKYSQTNCTFSKWAKGSASGTKYAAGASVTLTASTTFYATWTVNAVTNKLLASGNGGHQSDGVYYFNTTNYSSVIITMQCKSVWAYFGICRGTSYNSPVGTKATGTANRYDEGQYDSITLDITNTGNTALSFGISPSGGYGGEDSNTDWKVYVTAK